MTIYNKDESLSARLLGFIQDKPAYKVQLQELGHVDLIADHLTEDLLGLLHMMRELMVDQWITAKGIAYGTRQLLRFVHEESFDDFIDRVDVKWIAEHIASTE
jgi:hypothetical protein